jgi:putative transposase
MDHRYRLHRRRSYNEPGHVHELTFTCYRRFRFLGAERTCLWLAEAINEARLTWGFALWAYVFMPEHVHLIVYPLRPAYRVSEILKAIKEPVGVQAVGHLRYHAPRWLPKITRVRGGRTERCFWESGGGYDRNITDARTLMAAIDYIHQNPTRRGLAERPEDWYWSSARWFAGTAENPLRPDRVPPEWSP